MKKSPIIICVIIILFSINAIGQPQQKGKFFIGGLAGFSINNTDSEGVSDYRKYTGKRLNIGIPFGYFVSNTFLVGILSGYEQYTRSSKGKYSQYYSENELNSNQFTIGPFVRSYFKISEKVNFFMDLNAIVGFGKESSSYFSKQDYEENGDFRKSEGKLLSFSTGIYPGISIQMSKWLFLDVGVGRLAYDYRKYTPDTKSDTDQEDMNDSFAFSFNSFKFGLSAKLGK